MTSDPPPIGIAWSVAADLLPEEAFETHRELLIHETGQINDFLTLGRQNRKPILAAPKGYGKTLLLIAKHALTRHTDKECKCLPPDSIDQASGQFAKGESQRWLLNLEYRDWVDIWQICINLFAIKSSYSAEEIRPLHFPHGWYRSVLENTLQYGSTTTILQSLLEQPERQFRLILDNFNFLSPLREGIKDRVAVFIDKIDVFFDSILDT